MEEVLNSVFFQAARNIIDILCVAYLIYFCYKLFEDTNSITIAKGFVTIIIIYGIANLIDLKVLSWIFKYVVNNFVLLIVVLFQPEIRRVLSRVGQSGISGLHTKVSKETLNEIAEAVFLMSANKTGGLIIMERNVGLKQLLEEATLIDASVKAEMLLSIFYKGNILHDGAVMIESNRITAAQVIIPSIKIDAIIKNKSGLGTRHRAGIAVTTDSDAIAIITSEETGNVSIAHKGKLEQALNYDEFTRRIHELFGLE
jgi:diadenylate cyclase